MRVTCSFQPCRRTIPNDAAEAVELAKLLLNERGYIVLATQSPGRGYHIQERTKVLWSIRQEQPFTITSETDQKDWDEQIDRIGKAYPNWAKKECDESRSRFWRAVTD
jgi:hypothetical protein